MSAATPTVLEFTKARNTDLRICFPAAAQECHFPADPLKKQRQIVVARSYYGSMP